ncbi:hypothetical protein CBR_g4179 [Chara braunii]|uniref:Right handed beta helix domain-containing protein n=1 Tax=Chara braunii TaxID=69332 RepID=A0A388KHF2_CHABU|nr:hypothetical protein CBR_g4179 [Chara braunii]|eukprot:GBG69485.1 hypothetical protein CBR_g4179 [Chara braunii]
MAAVPVQMCRALALAVTVVVLALSVLPEASGYGVKEFLADYKNPKVSRIEVKGDVYLTSNLPELSRNVTIVGVGKKRPVIDGQNKYSGIVTDYVLSVRNLEFRNLVTTRFRGGAAILSFGDNNKFENCVFRNNRAFGSGDSGDGGAINFYSNTWRITNCQFIANRASQTGGALYALGESSGKLTGSTFTNNYAKDRGGAVALIGSFATIDKCAFQGNQADGDVGGAVSCSRSGCYISRNSFRNNVVNGTGGALRFYSDDEGGYGVLCKGNTFSGNRAADSSTNNLHIVVQDTVKSWSFCAKAPSGTKVDAPSSAIEYGNCRRCPK